MQTNKHATMLPNCMSHMNHMECIFLGCVTHLVHDLVPVLAGEDLEDGEHGDGEGVEVGGRDAVGEAEGAAEELRGSHNCNYMVTIVTCGHTCMPRRAAIRMKRKRSNSSEMIDFIEDTSDTSRLRSDDQ